MDIMLLFISSRISCSISVIAKPKAVEPELPLETPAPADAIVEAVPPVLELSVEPAKEPVSSIIINTIFNTYLIDHKNGSFLPLTIYNVSLIMSPL